MPRQIAFILAVAFATIPARAQEEAPALRWTRQIGYLGYDTASLVETESGVTVVGRRAGAICSQSYQAYVASVSLDGSFEWHRCYDAPWVGRAAPDSEGGLFLLGGCDLDNAGPCLGRTNARGDLLWMRDLYTWVGGHGASAVHPDGEGGVLLTGTTDPELPDWHAFIARIDGTGQLVWRTVIEVGEAAQNVQGYAMASDGNGGTFVAGRLHRPEQKPSSDGWLAHFDAAGNQQWIQFIGCADSSDSVYSLLPDSAGGVFAAGETACDLAAPFGGGWHDAFVARFDGSGRPVWIAQFGTDGDDVAAALTEDGVGGIYVAGATEGSIGGPNRGATDVFLTRFSASGQRAWVTQFGSTDYDGPTSMAVLGRGLIISGETYGDLGGDNAGVVDAFIARFTWPCPPDFDGDEFLTGLDFDAFTRAFEEAHESADFDSDGFITGADFDTFIQAFEQGC